MTKMCQTLPAQFAHPTVACSIQKRKRDDESDDDEEIESSLKRHFDDTVYENESFLRVVMRHAAPSCGWQLNDDQVRSLGVAAEQWIRESSSTPIDPTSRDESVKTSHEMKDVLATVSTLDRITSPQPWMLTLRTAGSIICWKHIVHIHLPHLFAETLRAMPEHANRVRKRQVVAHVKKLCVVLKIVGRDYMFIDTNGRESVVNFLRCVEMELFKGPKRAMLSTELRVLEETMYGVLERFGSTEVHSMAQSSLGTVQQDESVMEMD